MQDLVRMLQFGDSALPIGSFAFSNGLESAIAQGVVSDLGSLQEFVKVVLDQSASGDAVALLNAYKAVENEDLNALLAADTCVFNRKLNEESRNMTVRIGKKLLEISKHVFQSEDLNPTLEQWRSYVLEGKASGTYPIALAVIFSALKIPVKNCFIVHQYGVASATLSAAIRLMKVGHNDTQTILFKLNHQIDIEYETAAKKTLNDMATFAPVLDALAAVHVKAHVRLFMN